MGRLAATVYVVYCTMPSVNDASLVTMFPLKTENVGWFAM